MPNLIDWSPKKTKTHPEFAYAMLICIANVKKLIKALRFNVSFSLCIIHNSWWRFLIFFFVLFFQQTNVVVVQQPGIVMTTTTTTTPAAVEAPPEYPVKY